MTTWMHSSLCSKHPSILLLTTAALFSGSPTGDLRTPNPESQHFVSVVLKWHTGGKADSTHKLASEKSIKCPCPVDCYNRGRGTVECHRSNTVPMPTCTLQDAGTEGNPSNQNNVCQSYRKRGRDQELEQLHALAHSSDEWGSQGWSHWSWEPLASSGSSTGIAEDQACGSSFTDFPRCLAWKQIRSEQPRFKLAHIQAASTAGRSFTSYATALAWGYYYHTRESFSFKNQLPHIRWEGIFTLGRKCLFST